MTRAASHDLSSRAFFEDPHPTFHRLRAEDPVHWFEPLRAWMLTRYDHVDAVVRDERRFRNHRARALIDRMMPGMAPEAADGMAGLWSEMAWFQDAPGHTRLRQFMNKGFTPQLMESLRRTIAAIVDEALAPARDTGQLDVAEHLAEPVAINTLAGLFGIPAADRAQFREWITVLFKSAGAAAMTEEASRKIQEYTQAMFGYIAGLVEDRVKSPGDDTISRFLSGDDPPSVDVVTKQCYQIIVAGYRTSSSQIGNTFLALLQNPAELAELRRDPALLQGAVEEGLRYDTSVLVTNRQVAEDVELGGVRIREGELVFPIVAAANRDPAVFPDPDRFDIRRRGVKHLAFSMGPHYCIGAPLVRVELEEAIRGLLSFPRWELDGTPRWGEYNLSDRGLATLPLRVSASSQA